MMASSLVGKRNISSSTDGSVSMSKNVTGNTGDKSFHCAACSRGFKSNDALKQHLKRSRAHKAGPIFALTESVAFGNAKEKDPVLLASPVSAHSSEHEGFRCKFCHKRFGSQGALDMHLQDTHLNSSELKDDNNNNRPTTVSKRIVKNSPKHVRVNITSSTSQQTPEVTPDLFCVVCDRSFLSKNGLEMHIRTSKEHKVSLAARSVQQETRQYPSTKARWDGTIPQEIPVLLSTDSTLARTKDLSDQAVKVLTPLAPAQQQNATPVPTVGDPSWTSIPEERRKDFMNNLSRMCHPRVDLEKSAYRLDEYTPGEIDGYRKCTKCNGYKKDLRKKTYCFRHLKGKESRKKVVDGKEVIEVVYSCCGRLGRGCIMSAEHEFGQPDHFRATLLKQYRLTPEPEFRETSKRWAVALDCEMVGVQSGLSEVIRLCAVDFLTGEVLIDRLVVPDERVVQWRTKYSGVTRQMLAEANYRGETLRGWLGARTALYKYIDSDTILIGQSLQNDLPVLRMVHTRIVDSAILTKNIVEENCPRQWSLKTLCKELLGVGIQRGKAGHNCLEDTLAAREVVLFCIQQPERLEAWAEIQREEIRKEREERKRQKEEKEKEKEKAAAAARKREEAGKEDDTVEDQERKDDNVGIVGMPQAVDDLISFDDDAGIPVAVA